MKLKHIHNLLICLALTGTYTASAQKARTLHLGTFDQRIIHFGFVLGINSADFTLEASAPKDSLLSVFHTPQTGFNLGIVSDLHLGPYIGIRFTPTLSFTQRNLQYTFVENNPNTKTEILVFEKFPESTFVDFPLGIKYRSTRQNNFAAYIYAGGKYSLDLASSHKVDNTYASMEDIVIKLKKSSYMYEVAFGMDFFLEYFKFSPELKMGYGINNIIINDNTVFSDPIDKLKSKMFTLSFTFEG